MLRRRLADWIISRADKRPPDFVIRDDYLKRWWLIPRNRFFNIYLHQIVGSDDDRALHDHPWVNCSIILRGTYREWVPGDTALLWRGVVPKGSWLKYDYRNREWLLCLHRRAGNVVFRWPWALHRLELVEGPVWSLFITGPKVRSWGFQCGERWVPWREFVDPADTGKVGRGCGD